MLTTGGPVNTTQSPDVVGQPRLLDDPDLIHVFCCDENTGLCGLDLSECPLVPVWTPTSCVVCNDLEEQDVPCRPGCENWGG